MNTKAEQQHLEGEASRVVALAMELGADTAVASLNQITEYEVEVRNQDVTELQESQSRGVRLTVSKQQRRATVSSSDLSADSIRELVERAIHMCRYTDRDPFYRLPDRERMAWENPDLDLFDASVPNIDSAEKVSRARELEALMLAHDDRLKSNGAGVWSIFGCTALANSLGFAQSRESSLIGASVAGFAEDRDPNDRYNQGRKQTAGWSTRARHREDLQPLTDIAEIAAQRVLRKLGGRKPKTGKYPVYFEPNTARGLWRHLTSAMLGGNIYRDKSYLRDRIHQVVASPLVNIREEPRRARGLASRNYDGEGVATQDRDLIVDGVLQTYLLNTYTAAKLNTVTTGHAGGTSNVIIQPGKTPERDLLRQMGTGVWITGLLGSGVKIDSGDYSRGASGFWVENGEILYPILEFTINSNLDRMMRGIVGLTQELDSRGALETPGVLIDEMTISGV